MKTEQDIFTRIQDTSAMMAEAYQAFQSIMDDFGASRDLAEGNEISHGNTDDESMDDELNDAMSMPGQRMLQSDDASDDVFNHDTYEGEGAFQGYEAFPGRKFFRPDAIDVEDPAFASGKELGIPVSMTVHYSSGQHKEVALNEFPWS